MNLLSLFLIFSGISSSKPISNPLEISDETRNCLLCGKPYIIFPTDFNLLIVSLLMIRSALADLLRAVDLFFEHYAGELVWKGHF